MNFYTSMKHDTEKKKHICNCWKLKTSCRRKFKFIPENRSEVLFMLHSEWVHRCRSSYQRKGIAHKGYWTSENGNRSNSSNGSKLCPVSRWWGNTQFPFDVYGTKQGSWTYAFRDKYHLSRIVWHRCWFFKNRGERNCCLPNRYLSNFRKFMIRFTSYG